MQFRLDHDLVPLLLLLYAGVYEANLQRDARMAGNSAPIDVAAVAETLGLSVQETEKRIERLEQRGLLVRRGSELELQDPLGKTWPPVPFAMLPAPFVAEKILEVREECEKAQLDLGDVLALYIVFVAQRNKITGEIWYSREKTPAAAGLAPDLAYSAVNVLLRAGLVQRPSRVTWIYKLAGFTQPPRRVPRPAPE